MWVRFLKMGYIFQLVSVYFCTACAAVYLLLWLGLGDSEDWKMFLLSVVVGVVINVSRIGTRIAIEAEEEDNELRA